MRHSASLLLIGCVTLATLATVFESCAAETLCPHCVCLPNYSPVCGRMRDGRMRGFTSRCVLECTNKCRKNKFEFFFNGRCGKAPTSTTTTPPPPTPTTTTTETPTVSEPIVDIVTLPSGKVLDLPVDVEEMQSY